MSRLFGTDGVRGVANEKLTPELAFALGRAGAFVLTKEKHHLPKIIVGMDTRISCDMLASALCAGICSVGATAYNALVVPTPCVAFLVRKYKFDAGVVISASHNTVSDNGIKFFNSDGYKLPDCLEDEIEQIISPNSESLENLGLEGLPRPTGGNVGTIKSFANAIDDYIEFLGNAVCNISLKGMKIALDCANGATFEAAPKILKKLGAEIYTIGDKPNGININLNCGSTHMEALVELVKEIKADIGIAFDGDGDRCLVVDETGKIVSGDEIMSICAYQLKQDNKLAKNTIVATVMSNLGLFLMGKKLNIDIKQTKVGDRYVLEEMLANGYCFGGEQSGHIIFLEHNTTGDGILTSLMLLLAMKATGKKLTELNVLMDVLPQVLVNAKVANDKKEAYLQDEQIMNEIKALENKFNGVGRVLIRSSGTEPLVRVMIEGKDEASIKEEAQKIANMLEQKFAV